MFFSGKNAKYAYAWYTVLLLVNIGKRYIGNGMGMENSIVECVTTNPSFKGQLDNLRKIFQNYL